jgi:hypothetical protein
MFVRIRSSLTYANVMASLAVVLAVGAGGFAVASVPDKEGSIPGCFVAKGKKAGDLRVLVTGTRCRGSERKIVWNRRGPAGAAGTAGTQGVRGPQGIAGPPGPSEAFNQGLFSGGPGLQLAAGSYFVQAVVQGTNAGASSQDLACTLSIGSASDAPGIAQDIKTTTISAGGKGVVTLHQIHQLSGPGPANVSCTGPSWSGTIVAIRVGTTHEI